MNRMKLSSLLVSLAALSACGASQTDSNLQADRRVGGMQKCTQVQNKVEKTYSSYNSIGISADAAGNCLVSLTYESGKDLLTFVDQVIADGLSPLTMVARGKTVRLTHEVIGQIVPEAFEGAEQIGFAVSSDLDSCNELKDQFTKSLGANPHKSFAVNGIGIGQRFGGECNISVHFESAAGYRKYVATRVRKQLDPTSHVGKVINGNTYRIYVEASQTGPILPL
jgi:hypothetical protein